jgi:hypothetical protein
MIAHPEVPVESSGKHVRSAISSLDPRRIGSEPAGRMMGEAAGEKGAHVRARPRRGSSLPLLTIPAKSLQTP